MGTSRAAVRFPSEPPPTVHSPKARSIRAASDLARYAYAWALANVEYIVQKDGMGDINRILDRIGSGMSTEAALKEVLHSDYNDLMQSTAEYLKKTYGR